MPGWKGSPKELLVLLSSTVEAINQDCAITIHISRWGGGGGHYFEPEKEDSGSKRKPLTANAFEKNKYSIALPERLVGIKRGGENKKEKVNWSNVCHLLVLGRKKKSPTMGPVA